MVTEFHVETSGFPKRLRAIRHGGAFYDITEGRYYTALAVRLDPTGEGDQYHLADDDSGDDWWCPVELFEEISTWEVQPPTLWQRIKEFLHID